MIITLEAPKVSAADTKLLTGHGAAIEGAIAEVEGDYAKVKKLRAKEKELEREALTLYRDAANFQRDAELNLLLNQKTLARVHDAIAQAEAACHDDKVPLYNIIDRAQELVSKICQATLNQLLDQIATVLSPYYRSFDEARYIARNAIAVNDLVTTLLNHRTNAGDSIERLIEAARETLRKVEALLTGGEIWRYEGGESEVALEPHSAA